MINDKRLVFAIEQKKENTIFLTPEQNHYLKRVLRLTNGSQFIAMNGRGKSWIARLEDNRAICLEIIKSNNELPINITLITALPKANGYEQIIRCCTELGVNRFIPVQSDRTILKPSENKVIRWRKIAIEAAEQSERQIVPHIVSPVSFKNAIADLIPHKSDRYICTARGERASLSQSLTNSSAKEIIIATGTEGGWTEDEIKLAIDNNFQPVSLGKRILRAITAPITALSIVVANLE